MKKPGRNDLCWCGSGKKYKKCHMEQDTRLFEYEKEGFTIPSFDLIKTPEQIEGIRKSGIVTNEILDIVAERIKEGVTTSEIDDWVSEHTAKRGAIAAPLNYFGFPKSVCTSINNVICHGIPDNTVLKSGDIINIDVSTILDGYYSDASRMFIIGEASENAVKLVEETKKAMYIGIDEVKPYGSLNAVGTAIENYCNKLGYSVVRDLGGHGVGLKFHEEPHVDHFAKDGKGVLLLPGMVFTVEPMINEGDYKCITLDDDWTVLTKDGSLSAQWEHTIVVTENGSEILV